MHKEEWVPGSRRGHPVVGEGGGDDWVRRGVGADGGRDSPLGGWRRAPDARDLLAARALGSGRRNRAPEEGVPVTGIKGSPGDGGRQGTGTPEEGSAVGDGRWGFGGGRRGQP